MKFRLLVTEVDGQVMLPFAVDEQECANVAAGDAPIVHIWRHSKALVLGLRDRRLPYARKAMDELEAEGWSVAVRNSGGAAVPLDNGVVNVTMIVPSETGIANIHADFHAMVKVVQGAVSLLSHDAQVRSGEIVGAYCPGEYDLSIGGYKFCGIAQRRRIGAYIVQAFIVVEGSGAERVRTVARYYREASGGIPSSNALQVSEDSTRSLQELLGQSASITAERFADAIRSIVLSGSAPIESAADYSKYDPIELQKTIATMKRRYDTE